MGRKHQVVGTSQHWLNVLFGDITRVSGCLDCVSERTWKLDRLVDQHVTLHGRNSVYVDRTWRNPALGVGGILQLGGGVRL